MKKPHRVASFASVLSCLFIQPALSIPDKWKSCDDIPVPATVHSADDAAYVMQQCDSRHVRLILDTGDSQNLNLTLTSPTFDSELAVQDESALNSIQLAVAANYKRKFRAGPTRLRLQNLTHVKSIQATGSGFQTIAAENIRIQDLPALETLDLLGVAPFGDTQRPSSTEHNLTISSVAALNSFTYYPLTTQEGYITFPNQTEARERKQVLNKWPMSVRGIDGISNLRVWQDRVSNLEIGGGGNLTVTFSNSTRVFNDDLQPVYVTLQLSGLKTMARTPAETASHDFTINVGNFSLENSPQMKQLPIIFDHIGALVVRDNEQLETVLFDRNKWPGYNQTRTYEVHDPQESNVNQIDYVNGKLTTIEFTNNPKLNMKAAKEFDKQAKDEMQPVWVWPSWETQSMIFNGNFTNEFFAPLIELKKDTKAQFEKKKQHKDDIMPGRVVQKFVVNSDQGDKFDCSGLIGLKHDGFFPGEFSCQGESAAGTFRSSLAMVLLAFIVSLSFN